jgi:hypothetical protein
MAGTALVLKGQSASRPVSQSARKTVCRLAGKYKKRFG